MSLPMSTGAISLIGLVTVVQRIEGFFEIALHHRNCTTSGEHRMETASLVVKTNVAFNSVRGTY